MHLRYRSLAMLVEDLKIRREEKSRGSAARFGKIAEQEERETGCE